VKINYNSVNVNKWLGDTIGFFVVYLYFCLATREPFAQLKIQSVNLLQVTTWLEG
jgi:hypothetical protein